MVFNVAQGRRRRVRAVAETPRSWRRSAVHPQSSRKHGRRVLHEALLRTCRVVKSPPFADRNHLILGAVQEQDGRADPIYALKRIEPAPHHQANGKERILLLADVGD